MQGQTAVKELQTLLNETKINAEIPSKKLIEMQEIYFKKNPDFYNQTDLTQLRYYLKTVCYKFYLANFSLEQLWALSLNKRNEIFFALYNSLDQSECSDNELLLSSFILEGFLFQSMSFLEFYRLYIYLFLKPGIPISISTKDFYNKMDKIQKSPFDEKAQDVKKYFQSKVFRTNNGQSFEVYHWGTLLEDLRNKVAHRDRLRPSFDSKETLVEKVLFNWPTLQKMTYDRFCQYMQNGMFSLITNISPILYELEWKSGPYNPDLWKEDL